VWHTTDRGITYTLGALLAVKDVRLHPAQPNWLLASTMTRACEALAVDETSQQKETSSPAAEAAFMRSFQVRPLSYSALISALFVFA
jgi:hypothetical protein